jgi:hypothetical protein
MLDIFAETFMTATRSDGAEGRRRQSTARLRQAGPLLHRRLRGLLAMLPL